MYEPETVKKELKDFAGIKSYTGDYPVNPADEAFYRAAAEIFLKGDWDTDSSVRPVWADGTPAYAGHIFGFVQSYDLYLPYRWFPAMSYRKTNIRAAVDEILWIWQKKSNNICDLGSHIWDSWADETGSIGKAYGYQLGKKSIYPEGVFDQVDRVLWQLKKEPRSRRIMTTMDSPEERHEMHLQPCAHSVTLNVVHGTDKTYRLNMVLHQRSQDLLTAHNWNVVQYAVLLMMFAQVSDMEPGTLLHVVADAHIYDRHVPAVIHMLKQERFEPPKVTLNPDIGNFYDFTPDDVIVEDYKYNDFPYKIEVAV